MLAKFKIEAGAAFTKSAEGMMKDVKISEDTLEEYKRNQESTGKVSCIRRFIGPFLGTDEWSMYSRGLLSKWLLSFAVRTIGHGHQKTLPVPFLKSYKKELHRSKVSTTRNIREGNSLSAPIWELSISRQSSRLDLTN